MYLFRQPTDTSTISTNHLDSFLTAATPANKNSDIEQSLTNGLEPAHPSSGKGKVEADQLQSSVPEIKTFVSLLKQGSTISKSPAAAINHQTEPRTFLPNIPSYTKEKSIEKTVFSDFDAQFIAKIQKHAEGIIMNDLKRESLQNSKKDASDDEVLIVPRSTTVQPKAAPKGSEIETENIPRSTFTPEIKKMIKTSHSDTINSLKSSEKLNTNYNISINRNNNRKEKNFLFSDVSSSPSFVSYVKSTRAPSSLIDAKSTNQISNSNNSTLCESNLCEQDNNRALSDSLISIKPRKDIGPDSEASSGANARKLTHTFYPQNQLKEERHYVTTIDVQKGISLEVLQNEDGSIQLATNFPFNKLPGYRRPYHAPPNPAVISNPTAHGSYSSGKTVNFIGSSVKPVVLSTVTPSPELYDVTSKYSHGNALLQNQIHNQSSSDYYYELPKPILPELLQSTPTRDQYSKAKEATEFVSNEHNSDQDQQQILYNINSQRGETKKKQNFVEEERKEYFENLKKVEELKQKNSVTPHPNIDLKSNILGVGVGGPTELPLVGIETNSVTPTTIEDVSNHFQLQYVPELLPNHYPTEFNNYVNDISEAYARAERVQNAAANIEPVVAYATQQYVTSAPDQSNYRQGSPTQNAYVANVVQEHPTPLQSSQNVEGTQYVKAVPVHLQPRYEFIHQQTQVGEKAERVQPLPISQDQINAISVHHQSRFLNQEKLPELDKTLLINPVASIGHVRPFKIEQPVALVQPYPIQIHAASEQIAIPVLYQLPQIEYKVPVSLPVPQPTTAFDSVYSNISPQQQGNNQFRPAATPYRGPNKLRIQPLKPSPPAEDANKEYVQSVLSQPQFQSAYFYDNQPPSERLQLRHVGRKNQPGIDQITAQSLIRRGKSLKNLKIEYGFKPPLRPSVEFSGEVKPSIYGPSVPKV